MLHRNQRYKRLRRRRGTGAGGSGRSTNKGQAANISVGMEGDQREIGELSIFKMIKHSDYDIAEGGEKSINFKIQFFILQIRRLRDD